MPNQEKGKFGADIGLGPVGKTPLHFIWICDVSDSMRMNGKIDAMNTAIEQAIVELRKFNKNAAIKIYMKTIKFSTGAEWLDRDIIPVENYQWTPLQADGVTDLGEALSKVADLLQFKGEGAGGIMPRDHSKKPHLVLISDGYPTDDWESGLKKLMSTFWGERAVRMAISLDDLANEVLEQFVGNVPEAKDRMVKADSPAKLIECVKLMSEMVMGRVPGEKYGDEPTFKPSPVIPESTEIPPPPPADDTPGPEASDPKESPGPGEDKKEEITKIPEEVEF